MFNSLNDEVNVSRFGRNSHGYDPIVRYDWEETFVAGGKLEQTTAIKHRHDVVHTQVGYRQERTRLCFAARLLHVVVFSLLFLSRWFCCLLGSHPIQRLLPNPSSDAV